MNEISIEQALELINRGGWSLSGGKKDCFVESMVKSIRIDVGDVVNDVLRLYSARELVASVTVELLAVQLTSYEGRPRQLAFKGPFFIQEQRKQIDGGGWNKVERIGTLLLLSNDVVNAEYFAMLHEKHVQEEKAKQQRDRLAREAKEEEERLAQEKAQAEYAQYLAEYVARQNKRLRGLVFEDLCIDDNSVTVKFRGGIELTVRLIDAGNDGIDHDSYDDWSVPAIHVSIGGECL